jgi:serine/threonine-protein kinase
MTGLVASDEEVESDRGLSLRRGTRLGRYELLLPIAKGGMARVWAARQHGQRGFTKLVAIKTILPHLAREPEFERMFLDEARIASLVHQPNVCEIYELGEEGQVLYLAMEWVHGDSLIHMLRTSDTTTEPIPLRIAARIVADACAGLHAAHELVDEDGQPMNVVHRDVSPHNILVSVDGHVKVADFGVAKALGQLHQATVAGQIKGKLSYMAPEQVTGAPVDRRSDIFSLGCVLYEACTGMLPFLGEADHQIMHALLRGEYIMPTKLVRGFPPELEAIIARALASDPNKRYSTAERMRIALEEWLLSTGSVVTAAHVAQIARERAGATIDKRKEKIKEASQAGDRTPGVHASIPPVSGPGASGVQMVGGPNGTPPPGDYASYPGGESYPTGTETGYTPGPSAGSYLAAACIGIFVALLLGAGGIFAWRALSKPPQMVVVAAPEATGTGAVLQAPAAQTPPPTSGGGPTVVTPTTTAAATTAAAPAVALTLRTSPDDATVVVDGMALPPGLRQVMRPPHGAVITIRVTASGYQETTRQLDDTAPEVVDIALKKREVRTGGGGFAAGGGGGSPSNAGSETRKPKETKDKGPSIPDSPY